MNFIIFICILFIGIVMYYVSKTEKSENAKDDLLADIQNLEEQCKEINELVSKIEELCDKEIEYQPKEEEIQETSYYDDYVSEEEIQQALENIQDDKLTDNEIIFLKFMNNKEIKYTFSPRWEFQYDIKPRIEVAKLMQLEYLTYSSWYDNVKNATTKELKGILKEENLKVSGNKQELIERVLGNIDADLLEEKFSEGKYILTNKGIETIEENKILFMSDREKAGEQFKELTDYDYKFLEELGITRKYIKIKQEMLSINNSYTTDDILWSLFNTVKDELVSNKKYEKAGYIYDKMFRICFNDKRYIDALIFLLCSTYLEGYNTIKEIEEEDQFSMESWFEINIYDLHDRVKVIEQNTSIIKDKGIDWLILNSIDKYLKPISKDIIKKAFKAKMNIIFGKLK